MSEMKWTPEAIRKLRRDRRMTQAEFAEVLGCRPQTISEWEIGHYTPKNAYHKLLNILLLRESNDEGQTQ